MCFWRDLAARSSLECCDAMERSPANILIFCVKVLREEAEGLEFSGE